MVEHRLIPVGSEEYPVGLRDIEDPPSIYVSGVLTPATGIGVVGTRRCTSYGSNLAEQFGKVLAGNGWTVVSGLARGIDAAAHQGTVAANGHAVAVLGTGIDGRYPTSNRRLYDSILDRGGALVSEYGPGVPAERWRFPARNRLIAAMSAAVVVVEAGDRGGALITARLAAEIGRPVLVVPGDVDRPVSVGCNRLIRDGAFPVLGVDDLVEELELLVGPAPQSGGSQESGSIPNDGIPIDKLAAFWSCSTQEALVQLGRLEATGAVKRVGDRMFPV
jgi:DNA processing protein